jgi:hypothetical protein
MIDLMEMFGHRLKVDYDRKRHSLDLKAIRGRPCSVSTEKPFYYSILCKYGDINIADEADGLVFYCRSARVAHRVEKEMEGRLIRCLIGDIDGMIYFQLQHIEEIFQFAQPLKKREVSEERKRQLVAQLAEYRRTTAGKPAGNRFVDAPEG